MDSLGVIYERVSDPTTPFIKISSIGESTLNKSAALLYSIGKIELRIYPVLWKRVEGALYRPVIALDLESINTGEISGTLRHEIRHAIYKIGSSSPFLDTREFYNIMRTRVLDGLNPPSLSQSGFGEEFEFSEIDAFTQSLESVLRKFKNREGGLDGIFDDATSYETIHMAVTVIGGLIQKNDMNASRVLDGLMNGTARIGFDTEGYRRFGPSGDVYLEVSDFVGFARRARFKFLSDRESLADFSVDQKSAIRFASQRFQAMAQISKSLGFSADLLEQALKSEDIHLLETAVSLLRFEISAIKNKFKSPLESD